MAITGKAEGRGRGEPWETGSSAVHEEKPFAFLETTSAWQQGLQKVSPGFAHKA